MNIPDLSAGIEREGAAGKAGARRLGGGDSFGELVGRLNGRGTERVRPQEESRDGEGVEADASDEETVAASRREGVAADPSLARDMLGLLGNAARERATLEGERKPVADEGRQSGAQTGEEEGDALAARALLREAGSEVAALAKGKVKLEVVHMETHFEPGPQEEVVVLDEPAPGAAKTERGTSLLQILGRETGRIAPGNAARENASARPKFGETLARLSDPDAVPEAGSVRGAASQAAGAQGRQSSTLERIDALRAPATPSSQQGMATAAPLPMTGQVAARIIDAFAPEGAGRQARDLPPGETHLRMRAGGAALKTLTIQLQPESLGTLNVSMRLVDGELTLELAASRAETARVLLEDRASLRALLEKAGFSVEEKAITVVARDNAGPASAQRGGEGGDGAPGRNADGFSREEDREARQRHPQKDDGAGRREGVEEGPPRSGSASRGPSTYL